MNPALVALIWHLLATPRTPDGLIRIVQHIAPRVGKDAITHVVAELWATRLLGFSDGKYERGQRPILRLQPTYRVCACGRRLPVEYRRCRRCERVGA